MQRFASASAVVLALAAAGTVQAQEKTNYTADGFGPDQGSWELILGAAGSNNKEFDAGGFNLNAEVGYYLNKDLEVGGRQQLSFFDTGNDSSTSATTSAFVDYHFDFGAVRPFVGVSLGYIYGDVVNDSFIAGPEVGVKWYVKDETFIYGRAAYEFIFENGGDVDDNFDEGRFSYTVGIGFNF